RLPRPATGVGQRGQSQPAAEGAGDFGDVALAALAEAAEQARLAAVALVEGQPGEADAVGQRPVVQLQGDLPLVPVDQPVGDASGAAARAVGAPLPRQVQVAVEQAVEVAGGVAEVDGDDAVVHLAGGAAVLALDAGGLVPLLGAAAVVEDTDAVVAGVVAGDELLQPVAQPAVVPAVGAEELLQGADGDALVQGDGLGRLAGQVRQQAADISRQVRAGGAAREAVVEVGEEAVEHRPQPADLCGVHDGALATRCEGIAWRLRPRT